MTTHTNPITERQEAEAFKQVRQLRDFYLSLVRYFVAALALGGAYLFFSPQRWMLWVLGVWTLILALRAFRVFGAMRFLGPEWERQQVEKRLGRAL